MLISKTRKARPKGLPERIYVINGETIDNLEKISERSGLPEHIIMTACENTGLFFCLPNTAEPGRRIFNQLKVKRKQKNETTKTAKNIREMALALRLSPDTLFSICDDTGLFLIKAPTKVVSVHGVDYA